LRCIYCMPYGKNNFLPAREILTFEEIVKTVMILNRKGIEYIRITGGEPLMRRNLEVLIKKLKEETSQKEISMTTNGILLDGKLSQLMEAGLDRVNISLNTFKRNRYEQLTGLDKFEEVFSTVKRILSESVIPLKINIVLLKGINDDEIEDFADFTINNKVCVRFIEYFSTDNSKLHFELISGSLVKEKIEKKFGELIPCEVRGNGPAINYRINNAQGQIGFINTVTGNFCRSCNRLRLTAEGKIYPCLLSPRSIDVKNMLRNGIKEEKIKMYMDNLIFEKHNYSKKRVREHEFVMSDMGG